MKNKIVIAALLLLMILAIPMVFADDTNSLDQNTIQEVKTLKTPEGAHVRLLQLEKNISRNILIGDKTIEVITKNHPGTDTNSLSAKVDQLDALLSEVQNVDGNLSPTSDKNALAQQYVELKKEAISLTKDFREAVRSILTAQDKQEIRAAIKSVDENEMKEFDKEVKDKVHQFNASQIEAILNTLGAPNPDLITKIRDGNATPQEIQSAIKAAYDALSAEQKAAVGSILKEGILKRVVQEKQLVEDANKNLRERLQERVDQRLDKLQEWAKKRAKDLNEKGFEWRAKRMEVTSDRIQKVEDWAKNFLDRNKTVMRPPREGQPGREGPGTPGPVDDNGGDN